MTDEQAITLLAVERAKIDAIVAHAAGLESPVARRIATVAASDIKRRFAERGGYRVPGLGTLRDWRSSYGGLCDQLAAKAGYEITATPAVDHGE